MQGRSLRLWSIVAIVGLGAACASLRGPSVRTLFTEKGLDRAAFEMECPKEQLKLVQLNIPLDEPMDSGGQVGVTGCGKKAVYVYSSAGWVANTGSISDQGAPK